MDESIYLTLFIAFAINLLLLYFIISSATRSKRIERELSIQTELLAKMVQAAGVPDTIINDILTQPLSKLL